MPPLNPALSAEVLDRNGDLLRAYTVDDGRWRMAVDPAQVDPAFVAALVEYEDRRFRSHSGVDPRALARAVAEGAEAIHRLGRRSTPVRALSLHR